MGYGAIFRPNAGRVAGPQHKVDVETALKAITINAAYSIRLENEVGSIEPGKFANFTVLEQSPFEVDPIKLKDIKIWGTVLEGRVQPIQVSTAAKGALEKKASLGETPPPLAAEAEMGTRARRPLPALTSPDYLLVASRNANDQGLCNGHWLLMQVLAKGMNLGVH